MSLKAAIKCRACGVTVSEESDIITHHAAGTLPELLYERLSGHRTDEIGRAFRGTLVALHNASTIDLLDVARSIGSSQTGQHRFFTVMHLYTQLIPELEATVPEMMAAVTALVERAGQDLTAGLPNGAFREWAEKGDRAMAVLEAIDLKNPDHSAFLFAALLAMAKGDETGALEHALAYLVGPDAAARSAAAKAIGTFALEDTGSRDRAFSVLAAVSDDTDDNSLGHILTAACEIARSHPAMTESAVALLDSRASTVGDQAIHHLSFELMFHGEDLPLEIVSALGTIMRKVKIESRGTVENIDAAGGKLIRHGRLDAALELVTPLIEAHEEFNSLDTLDSFRDALLQIEPDRLARVMIGWLQSFDPNLGLATMNLVGHHHSDAPLVLELDRSTLGLDDVDLVVLTQRTIGFLFLHPIAAASLILGLLRGASEPAAQAMTDILFDPLLINFTGQFREWLEERSKDADEPARAIIVDLLARLEAYLQQLREAGRIKELGPSERERLIENHRQFEAMRQAHKRAEQKSTFMRLISRSVLLYGNRSISYFDRGDGKMHRNETKMHAMHHSMESPRLDILEPFDLDYRLRTFRAVRKKAQ